MPQKIPFCQIGILLGTCNVSKAAARTRDVSTGLRFILHIRDISRQNTYLVFSKLVRVRWIDRSHVERINLRRKKNTLRKITAIIPVYGVFWLDRLFVCEICVRAVPRFWHKQTIRCFYIVVN